MIADPNPGTNKFNWTIKIIFTRCVQLGAFGIKLMGTTGNISHSHHVFERYDSAYVKISLFQARLPYEKNLGPDPYSDFMFDPDQDPYLYLKKYGSDHPKNW